MNKSLSPNNSTTSELGPIAGGGQKIHVAGCIDWIDGLWFGGWVTSRRPGEVKKTESYKCELMLDGSPVFSFVASDHREDLLAFEHSKDGKGYSVQVPVYDFLSAVDGKDEVSFQIKVLGEVIEQEIKVKVDDLLSKSLNKINSKAEILARLPLVSSKSLKFLPCSKKMLILAGIYEAKLEKEVPLLRNRSLAQAMFEGYDEVSEEELSYIRPLGENTEFVADLTYSLNFLGLKHPLLGHLSSLLMSRVYLDSKEILIANVEDVDLRKVLITSIVSGVEERFNLTEEILENPKSLSKKWQEVEESERLDMWPILAGALQFNRRYDLLENVQIDLDLYLPPESRTNQSVLEKLLELLNDSERGWFYLSLVLNELNQGLSPEQASQAMLEYTWKAWELNYVNIDCFCYIANLIMGRKCIKQTIVNLADAFKSLFYYSLDANFSIIERNDFIDSITRLLNLGWSLNYHDISELESIVRSRYLINPLYLQKVEPKLYRSVDAAESTSFSILIEDAKWVCNLFKNLNGVSVVPVADIKRVISSLYALSRVIEVDAIAPWISTLTNYCLLHAHTSFYGELSVLNSLISDNSAMLRLSLNEGSKASVVRSMFNLRKNELGDCFNQVLVARSKGLDDTLDSLNDLIKKLILGYEYSAVVESELFKLVLGEFIRVCFKDIERAGQIKKRLASLSVMNLNSDQQQLLNTCKLVYLLSGESKAPSELLDKLAKEFGSINEINSFLANIGLKISDFKDEGKIKKTLVSLYQFNVFPYCQILLYSCEKYLSSRVQIFRDTWIKDLIKYDISYQVIVGGADVVKRAGDILKLDIEDTYESLPHKTVRMFNVSSKISNFQYYFKIDDDCVLNVLAMFSSPDYIGQDYYGRVITRPQGDVDRKWHHLKSSSPEARSKLDLSPEGSVYCDGGTGYILSRHAIQLLVDQYNAPVNRQIREASFFEDKMVGDLLGMAGLKPSGENYKCVVQRKFAGDRDIQVWHFGLYPHLKNGVKVFHTEDDQNRRRAWSEMSADHINLPPLLYRDPTDNLDPDWLSKAEQAPVLEIYKSDSKKIRDARTFCIIVGKNESGFLPNLLTHYRSIGIDHFLFVDNCSSDDSIDYMHGQDDVSIFIAAQDYKFSRFGVNWQQLLLQQYCVGKWAVIADSDELFVYDGFENHDIYQLIDRLESEDANAVLSPMIDMYPKGALKDAKLTNGIPHYRVCSYYDSMETMSVTCEATYGPYANSVVLSGGMRERVFGKYNQYPQPNYLNQKYNFLKFNPSMRFIEGLHFMQGHQLSKVQCGILHFKYHAGFHEKVVRELKAGQHWNGAKEYKRYAELFEGDGDPSVFDNECSLKYSNSSDLISSGFISKIQYQDLS